MPEPPFPITAKNTAELIEQTQRMFNEMYDERIGGSLVGDVVSIDSDDILTINIVEDGGLEKSGNQLKCKQADAITDASEISAIVLAAGVDTVDIPACNAALASLVTEINSLKDKVNELITALEGIDLIST